MFRQKEAEAASAVAKRVKAEQDGAAPDFTKARARIDALKGPEGKHARELEELKERQRREYEALRKRQCAEFSQACSEAQALDPNVLAFQKAHEEHVRFMIEAIGRPVAALAILLEERMGGVTDHQAQLAVNACPQELRPFFERLTFVAKNRGDK